MTYYRRVIVLEVLSDRPTGDLDLPDLAYEIAEGDSSGAILADQTDQVDADAVRGLLIAQGSDPEFLLGEDDSPTVPQQVGDPDATLTAFRDYLARGTASGEDPESEAATDLDRHEMLAYAAEAADALDQHMSAGGRPPAAWIYVHDPVPPLMADIRARYGTRGGPSPYSELGHQEADNIAGPDDDDKGA
jgi:hypothetical protein